jgi:hypothetical protein
MNYLALGLVLFMAALMSAGDSFSFFPTASYETAAITSAMLCGVLISICYLLYFGRKQFKLKIVWDALLISAIGGASFFIILNSVLGAVFTKYFGENGVMHITGKAEFHGRSISCRHYIRSTQVSAEFTNSKVCVPKNFYDEQQHTGKYRVIGTQSQAGFVVDWITVEKQTTE